MVSGDIVREYIGMVCWCAPLKAVPAHMVLVLVIAGLLNMAQEFPFQHTELDM